MDFSEKNKTFDTLTSWYQEKFDPSVNVVISEFSKSQTSIVVGHRALVQQLAIVSGTLATFSMMLIPSKMVVFIPALLMGVFFLLLCTALAFIYVFYAQRKDVDGLRKFEDRKIIPIMQIRSAYFLLLEHASDENIENFHRVKLESMKIMKEGQFGGYLKSATDSSDVVLPAIFLMGTLLIILSVVAPLIAIC